MSVQTCHPELGSGSIDLMEKEPTGIDRFRNKFGMTNNRYSEQREESHLRETSALGLRLGGRNDGGIHSSPLAGEDVAERQVRGEIGEWAALCCAAEGKIPPTPQSWICSTRPCPPLAGREVRLRSYAPAGSLLSLSGLRPSANPLYKGGKIKTSLLKTVPSERLSIVRERNGAKAPEGFKAAFTLAEVLITLGIIGVVAALTMPGLIAKHRDQEIIVRTRKTYSAIEQAIRLAQAAYMTPGDNSPLFASGKSHEVVTKELAKYFVGAKVCERGSNARGCKNLDYKLKLAIPAAVSGSNNSAMSEHLLGSYRIVLNNGAVLGIQTKGNDCETVYESGESRNPDGTLQTNPDGSIKIWERYRAVCGHIYFDVNGAKRPNQFGHDAFAIDILKDKVTDNSWTSGFGAESLHNILMGKKDPFVYTDFSDDWTAE